MGYALRYASEDMKNNKEVVLAAVQQNGEAFEYASKDMQSNKKFVLAAVQLDWLAGHFASEELQHNTEFIVEARRVMKYKNGTFVYAAMPCYGLTPCPEIISKTWNGS